MKVYRGWASSTGYEVSVNGALLSPTGVFCDHFEWGFDSVGDRELAFTVLTDLFDRMTAAQYYLQLTRMMFAQLDFCRTWTVTEEGIRDLIKFHVPSGQSS